MSVTKAFSSSYESEYRFISHGFFVSNPSDPGFSGIIFTQSNQIQTSGNNLLVPVYITDFLPASSVRRSNGGLVNGQQLGTTSNTLVVAPGASILGSLEVQTLNALDSGKMAPLAATVTWGDRTTQFWQVVPDVADGSSFYTVPVNQTAPTEKGDYHIVIAFADDQTAANVMSATGDALAPVWFDGNDVGFDWSNEQLDLALQNYGSVNTDVLTASGIVQSPLPATAYRIIVGLPPNQPGILLPANNATGISLAPTITSSAFEDPESVDTHQASQWQIRRGSDIILSTISTTDLTSITITSEILTYGTQYQVRVRHQDSSEIWSDWSAWSGFTTETDPADEGRIVYAVDGDIWIMNLAGKNRVQLTHGNALDSNPKFNSDGSRIAFSSDREGPFQIWIMDADGGNLQAFGTLQSGNRIQMAWSPDDSRMAATALGSDLHIVSQDSSEILISNALTQASHPGWNGLDSIVYAISPLGNDSLKQIFTINLLNTQTNSQFQITGQSDPKYNWPRWIDNNQLLFTFKDDIWISSLDGMTYENKTSSPDQIDFSPVFLDRTSNDIFYFLRSPAGNPDTSTILLADVNFAIETVIYDEGNRVDSIDVIDLIVAPNNPPTRPINLAPANNAQIEILTPVLESSIYDDPELHSHSASQWQIRIEGLDYDDPVLNQQSTTDLTSLEVEPAVLLPGQTYFWRVRYRDDQGLYSDWSEETSFSTPVVETVDDHVIIIAGGGLDSEFNPIFRQTQFLAGMAYRLSKIRGFPTENILLLSAFEYDGFGFGIDQDLDGTPDLLADLEATKANIEAAFDPINGFTTQPGRLYVYMIDHGSLSNEQWHFNIRPGETIQADELDALFDSLQETVYAQSAPEQLEIISIFDYCFSGGFVQRCEPGFLNGMDGARHSRICISSATDRSLAAYSGDYAASSFSNVFFDGLWAGATVKDAFRRAHISVVAGYNAPYPYPLQVPWLEDNWDGQISNKFDGQVAANWLWGKDTAFGSPTFPVIESSTADQYITMDDVTTLPLTVKFAPGVLVSRAWCKFTPPNELYNNGQEPEIDPVTGLPIFNPITEIQELELTLDPADPDQLTWQFNLPVSDEHFPVNGNYILTFYGASIEGFLFKDVNGKLALTTTPDYNVSQPRQIQIRFNKRTGVQVDWNLVP